MVFYSQEMWSTGQEIFVLSYPADFLNFNCVWNSAFILLQYMNDVAFDFTIRQSLIEDWSVDLDLF